MDKKTLFGTLSTMLARFQCDNIQLHGNNYDIECFKSLITQNTRNVSKVPEPQITPVVDVSQLVYRWVLGASCLDGLLVSAPPRRLNREAPLSRADRADLASSLSRVLACWKGGMSFSSPASPFAVSSLV